MRNMRYAYKQLKPGIFTEDGQVMFLKIRDNVKALLKESGAVAMGRTSKGVTGDSWSMMACVDRLVELGEIKEVPRSDYCPGQYRIFVKVDE